MLINLSNHPHSNWSAAQKKASSEQFGQVIDLPFPSIDPEADADTISILAEQFESKIQMFSSTENSGVFGVHIMGELTFCFALVARLQMAGITCLASTTKRITIDNPDGSKISQFCFERFREYCRI